MHRTLASLLTILLCFHSYTALGERDMDDMLGKDERIAINANGREQSAYYLPEASGEAHGGVLLLPDAGRHPLLQGEVNNLRYALADNHWHTLAVNTSMANADEASNIIAAGISYLNRQGVFNIAILGQGEGAVQAVNYIAERSPVGETSSSNGSFDQLRAVVLLHLGRKDAEKTSTLNEQLADLKLPILDAFNSGNLQQQKAAEGRRLNMRRNGQQFYQQARLPNSSATMQGKDNRTTKRIRGWLDRHAAGFMVNQ